MPIPVKDETGVEKETVGYTDHLKATLGRYGLTRICPATATIGYDNSDSSTIPRRKAIYRDAFISHYFEYERRTHRWVQL
jgi:hypothetical protein